MTTLDPDRHGSHVASKTGADRPEPPGPLRWALVLITVGAVIAGIDIIGDSVFLGRAFWLDTADPGMYTTQSGMFLPYLVLAIRGIAYIVIIAKLLGERNFLYDSGPDSDSARRRLIAMMAGCAVGGIGNAVVTIGMFWMAAYWVTGLRDETPGGLLEFVAQGEMSRLPWLGVGSVILDLVLLLMSGVVVTILMLSTTRKFTADRSSEPASRS